MSAYMTLDSAYKRIEALGERIKTQGRWPIYEEKIRVFIRAGLFLEVVVDGVVDKIFGPSRRIDGIGIPIHDPDGTQYYIRDYSMSHMPEGTPRNKGPICLDAGDVILLENVV